MKGRAEPVRIFEPIALSGGETADQIACAERYCKGLALWRAGDFAAAAAMFARFADVDPPSARFLERAENNGAKAAAGELGPGVHIGMSKTACKLALDLGQLTSARTGSRDGGACLAGSIAAAYCLMRHSNPRARKEEDLRTSPPNCDARSATMNSKSIHFSGVGLTATFVLLIAANPVFAGGAHGHRLDL